MTTLRTLRDGNVVLESRNNTKNIQIRIKEASGKYRRISAGTSVEKVAVEKAEYAYDEMMARVRFGLTPFAEDARFSEICDSYRKELENNIAANRRKGISKTYLTILNKWIAPFFSKYQVHEISDDTIHEHEQWRLATIGQEPSKSTINQHNVVLRELFQISARKKLRARNDFPNLTVKGKGRPIGVRPAFEEEEIHPLIRFLGRWPGSGVASSTRYKRRMLLAYVGIILFTGIRPGKEMSQLRWKHIESDYVDPQSGAEAVRIWIPHRKHEKDGTIPRVITERLALQYFTILRRLTRRTKKNDFLFAMPDGEPATGLDEMFGKALEEARMRLDRRGNRRSLYSLRHTYATRQITYRRVGWDLLAANMGTSMEMIQRHYSHLTVEMGVGELIGDMRGADQTYRRLLKNTLLEQRQTIPKNIGGTSDGKIEYVPVGENRKIRD